MRRECRERFPHHRLQRKPSISDPGMYHVTCVTHVPWCMSGSLTRGGGENVPGISGAFATRNFTYLVRGPYAITYHILAHPSCPNNPRCHCIVYCSWCSCHRGMWTGIPRKWQVRSCSRRCYPDNPYLRRSTMFHECRHGCRTWTHGLSRRVWLHLSHCSWQCPSSHHSYRGSHNRHRTARLLGYNVGTRCNGTHVSHMSYLDNHLHRNYPRSRCPDHSAMCCWCIYGCCIGIRPEAGCRPGHSLARQLGYCSPVPRHTSRS